MKRSGLFIAAVVLAASPCFAQQVFFGNLHSHTAYSDGSGTPDDAYFQARYVAQLDFLAITEHNHAAAESGATADRRDGILIATQRNLYEGPEPWALLPRAARWTEDGTFVALYGQEFSSISSGNHVNVFDVARVIDVPNGRFDQLVGTWLADNLDSTGRRAILQFNHPALHNAPNEYGADDFASQQEWIQRVDQVAQLIELINGPAMAPDAGHQPAEVAESEYRRYLNLGFHLAPTADQDNHYFTWGTATDARTGVIAQALTKRDLLEALRSRHVYATEDKNLRIIVRVNGHLCGDRLAAPETASELQISFSISDDDEPNASYDVEVWADTIGGDEEAAQIEVVGVQGDTSQGSIGNITYEGGAQYFYFKVIQRQQDGDRDRAWTAPVWLEPGNGTNSDTPPVTDPSNFVASRLSRVYHVSLECVDARRIKASNLIMGAEAQQGRRMHQGCPR